VSACCVQVVTWRTRRTRSACAQNELPSTRPSPPDIATSPPSPSPGPSLVPALSHSAPPATPAQYCDTTRLFVCLSACPPAYLENHKCPIYCACGWLGRRVVSVLDSGAEGPGFKSQSRRCQVTVLANCSHPLCLCSPSSEIGSIPLNGCEGNCRPDGK